MSKSLFKNRKLLIATQHGKEKVIAPLLEKNLGVQCVTNQLFNTDTLGTFSGETERLLDPIANAREKCLLAMSANNADLAIASEGSFGPHPSMLFIPADDEFLILLDTKNDLEIMVRELSTDTNFNGSQIDHEAALLSFAKDANFPSHGLILRKSKEEKEAIFKGITSMVSLKKTFQGLLQKYGSVYVETDMRAHFNPTRMRLIEKATHKLIEKINTYCPQCSSPGFGVTAVNKGLRCSACGVPTRSTLSYSYTCQKCNFTEEKRYPNKKTTEDPAYCDYCNP